MMLPVCSATPSHSQLLFTERLQPTFGCRKTFKTRYLVNSNLLISHASTGGYFKELSAKPLLVKVTGQLESISEIHSVSSTVVTSTHDWRSSMETVRDLHSVNGSYTASISDLAASNAEEGSTELIGTLTESTELMPREPGYDSIIDVYDNSTSLTDAGDSVSGFTTDLDNVTSLLNEQVDKPTVDIVPDSTVALSDSVSVGGESLPILDLSPDELTSGINISTDTNTGGAESIITSSVDAVTSSLQSAFTEAKEAIDSAVSQFSSTIDQTEESTGKRLESLWGDLKQATGRAGVASVDVLRHVIVTVEDSLSSVASLIGYSYGSARELLPPEIRDVLNVSEDTAAKVLVPVNSALEKASFFIVGIERKVGLDPDDPIVPFVVFLGTSASLWIFYQRQIYGGYAGDLSPNETLALLMGKENAVLIDVRPEETRERDGIPDLRRGARFRYASVDLPEFDSSVKKLLKSGRDLDDSLIAVVIKNLKIVQGKPKVVIMDVDGSRSKGIARSLRKLGIKGSYLMEGGFRGWVKQGLRVKELKPETTLSILNEEAEAILEEINPTPIQIIGSGLGLIAAGYAILEWERTLQLIGLVGIGLTIYWRVSTYNDSEDLKKDVRLLLAPVKMGAAALSWASGKLETNGNGLPTSPSSLDVQNRVLKAVAKHESQPPKPEETQDQPPSSDPASPVSQADL